MICEKVEDKSLGFEPAGLAPGHVDQSPGVFYLNLSILNDYKDPEIKKDTVKVTTLASEMTSTNPKLDPLLKKKKA